MPISDADYNRAKAILEKAGSLKAAKSHKKHGNSGGSPDQHGVDLLVEARDELVEAARRIADPIRQAAAVRAAKAEVSKAAGAMGITHW